MNEYVKKKEKKRVLQTKVIVGKGKSQFFVESDICIPPSPPIFKIVAVDAEVEVFDTKIITGGDCKWGWAKIIFNAVIKKNVIYKTVEHIHDGIVNGPLYAVTFKVPFGGYVDVEPLKGEKVKDCDIVEVLKAKFEGAKEVPHDEVLVYAKAEEARKPEIRGCRMPDDMRGCKMMHEEVCELKKEEEKHEVKVFKKLLEKMVVELEFKVVRTEHVCVEEEHYYDPAQAPLQEEPDLLPPE